MDLELQRCWPTPPAWRHWAGGVGATDQTPMPQTLTVLSEIHQLPCNEGVSMDPRPLGQLPET